MPVSSRSLRDTETHGEVRFPDVATPDYESSSCFTTPWTSVNRK